MVPYAGGWVLFGYRLGIPQQARTRHGAYFLPLIPYCVRSARKPLTDPDLDGYM